LRTYTVIVSNEVSVATNTT